MERKEEVKEKEEKRKNRKANNLLRLMAPKLHFPVFYLATAEIDTGNLGAKILYSASCL